MAHIRIIDEWLRSPVSSPSRQRAIFVVARSWSEQRVLMRAFSSCEDQTRPTIVLQGEQLAIGPAGTDPHAEWGIHVQPPVDGRAQSLRDSLQDAARRMAGSKGNPARLLDEVSEFDKKATGFLGPRSDEASQRAVGARTVLGHNTEGYYEPNQHAPTSKPTNMPFPAPARSKHGIHKKQHFWAHGHVAPGLQEGPPSSSTSLPVAKPKKNSVLRKTSLGFQESQTTQLSSSSNYAALAGKTLPVGFILRDKERRVINALGKATFLSANEIATLLKIENPMEWMATFMNKLTKIGLDLIAPGADLNGEATYILSR